jgi:hypothetical protein
LQITKKIAELESSTSRLAENLNRLSTRQVPIRATDPLAAALAKNLAGLTDFLEIQGTSDSVTLKPKARLRDRDFAMVRATVSEHGGFWLSERRMFVVPRDRSRRTAN